MDHSHAEKTLSLCTEFKLKAERKVHNRILPMIRYQKALRAHESAITSFIDDLFTRAEAIEDIPSLDLVQRRFDMLDFVASALQQSAKNRLLWDAMPVELRNNEDHAQIAENYGAENLASLIRTIQKPKRRFL